MKQEFADQRRTLEDANKNVQKYYNWLENKIDTEFNKNNFEQKFLQSA